MLAACIIVVACTLFCSNNHSFSFYRESCKLHFSQSVLTPLETGKDAREVKKKVHSVLELNVFICMFCFNISVENNMYIILMSCVLVVGPCF